MPIFHPVFNEFPIRKKVRKASWWSLLKARLFGKRIKILTKDLILIGWKYNGIFYITKKETEKSDK